MIVGVNKKARHKYMLPVPKMHFLMQIDTNRLEGCIIRNSFTATRILVPTINFYTPFHLPEIHTSSTLPIISCLSFSNIKPKLDCKACLYLSLLKSCATAEYNYKVTRFLVFLMKKKSLFTFISFNPALVTSSLFYGYG